MVSCHWARDRRLAMTLSGVWQIAADFLHHLPGFGASGWSCAAGIDQPRPGRPKANLTMGIPRSFMTSQISMALFSVAIGSCPGAGEYSWEMKPV